MAEPDAARFIFCLSQVERVLNAEEGLPSSSRFSSLSLDIANILDQGLILSHTSIMGSCTIPNPISRMSAVSVWLLEDAFSATIWCMTFYNIILCSRADWPLGNFGGFD